MNKNNKVNRLFTAASATNETGAGRRVQLRRMLRETLCLSVTGTVLLNPFIVFAQDSSTTTIESKEETEKSSKQGATILPVMTVKGTKDDSGLRTIPADVLQRTQALDTADIFATEPSVNVGGGARNAQRIYIRGIEGSNLNISVDGARQNTNMHQHRGGIGIIEPSLLKKVEVHPGPGADQGPGALGGSIRFETVDAQDLLEPDKKVGAQIRGGYTSADEGFNWSTTAYGGLENTGFLVHYSGVDTEDYRAGNGEDMPNTAAEDMDLMAKLSLLDYGPHSLRLSAEQIETEGLYLWGRGGSDMGIADEDSSPVRQRSERQSWTLDYRLQPDNDLVDTRLNIFTTDNQLTNITEDYDYSKFQIGGDLRNIFTFSLGATEHQLTTGLDYLCETGEAPRNFGTLEGQIVESESWNLGLFLQERMAIGKLGLSLGARLDDFEVDYGPTTFSGDEISPNVGADYEIVSGVTAFANYGEAVRGSGLIPVGWMANIYEGTNFNDGEDFEPETSCQTEGGLRYESNGLLSAMDHFKVELSLFQTDLENTIERDGGGGGAVSKIYNNPDTITSKGWEARFGWGIRSYETTIAFSHVDTEDQDGNPVSITRRKVAPTGDRLVWDNRWQVSNTLVLGGTLTWVSDLDDVPEGDLERDGYTLVDLQAQWSPSMLKGVTLSLVVNNLFDEAYSEQTSIAYDDEVILEAGTDVRVMASYRF